MKAKINQPTYTNKEVIELLMRFAQRLGQREGQYLATIAPCETFIKEFVNNKTK